MRPAADDPPRRGGRPPQHGHTMHTVIRSADDAQPDDQDRTYFGSAVAGHRRDDHEANHASENTQRPQNHTHGLF